MHAIMMLDFFTPFKAFDSPLVARYHQHLVSQLPDRPEIPLVELPLEQATKESLRIASRDYTFPVVIRGAMNELPALEKWKNVSWWVDEYGNEEVLCKYVEKVGDAPSCTIKDSLVPSDPNNRLYVSGEARIFNKRAELQSMVESPLVDSLAPGSPVFTQLFMGYAGMGSDVHAAIGCNMFRQIVGSKKWFLFPVSQTPYVYPSLNPNGFSAHTMTKIGKGEEEPSPWLSKLERYTVTLQPGDVMLNPPWFWHGIINMGEPDDLVIGVPTRYGSKPVWKMPSFKSNFLLSVVGVASIAYTYGLDKFMAS
eukprot:CAMPEP_0116966254 /NCGR_PEP_ID=MMETSP0467-20121206/49733_1 /TAXON_ID=283647 /ORGANISM="Mesodinium pulex, Strain SPMC105" /LENGTH=308 /DNA_ID=CAMNT_0004655711 /DNA_START=20 /DNA_END=946 /DNA_ORIENTATION=+